MGLRIWTTCYCVDGNRWKSDMIREWSRKLWSWQRHWRFVSTGSTQCCTNVYLSASITATTFLVPRLSSGGPRACRRYRTTFLGFGGDCGPTLVLRIKLRKSLSRHGGLGTLLLSDSRTSMRHDSRMTMQPMQLWICHQTSPM